VDTLTPIPEPKHWRALLAALTLLLGIGTVVVWNWYVLDQRQEQESQRRFERDTQAIAQLIQTRMRSYEMVLRGVSTAFTGPQQANVSHAQWQHIVEQLRVQELYPGISSVVWSRYLRANELDTWLKQVHADGRPDFKLFPQGNRDEYQIIQYIGPLNKRTARVVGMDILRQTGQTNAVQSARDSGKATLSMPLPDLYPATDDSAQMGLIMYFPVYRTGRVPDTSKARQDDLIGMTNAVFRGQELVDSIFGPLLHSFRIQARDTYTDQLLFDSQYVNKLEMPSNWQPYFKTSLELPLYGRTWHLDIASNPDYERALLSRSQDLILIMGLSTSVLVALLGGAFVYQRDRQMHGREKAALKLRNQAQQLMLANRYKTEFLANMSHELRTPLNSILILSDQLRQNTAGNLNEKQTKHADIIYRAGNDLLQLINDVLDLAKIEAGRIQINLETLNLQDILVDLDAAMRPLAESKKLHLYIPVISAESGVPLRVHADRGRLHQILRNLLSNAIKFTDEGQVSLSVGTADKPHVDGRIIISFAVRDTGIGIDPSQHEQVFAAFAQLDGSTRRRFGGTGLGLPITRQLVKALDGDIQLHSTPGQGSTFTVYLPMQSVEVQEAAQISTPQRTGEGPALLIVEDDANFAAIIVEQAQAHGFSSVHCSTGQQALELLGKESFTAIILDILLPDISGWQLFRRLRAQTQHRHTPVHIISCLPQPSRLGVENGTHYLTKPIGQDALEQVFSSLQQCQHPSHGTPLLLVEDVETERQHYQQKLNTLGFAVTACENAQQARALWSNGGFEVLVIDLNLPDQDGFSLLESLDALRSLNNTRVIVNTGLDVSQAGLQRLTRYSAVVVHKQGADIAALGQAVQGFLGQINVSPVTTEQKNADNTHNAAQISPLTVAQPTETSLHGQRVLLVDDDVRNVYAMSAILDTLGVCIHTASNGEQAISCFKQTPLDLILMDMSMPVMDGYTATHLLKTDYGCTLPIIALTAHAMKGDREKCLAAGADDYLAKPVEREQLRALLERWLLNVTNE